MSELAEQAAGAARRTRSRFAGEKLIPATAKLYSQHIRLATGQGRLATFDDQEFTRRLAEAVVLVDASIHGQSRGEDDWRSGLRRSAEVLEWLAHPDLQGDGLPLSLLSAAAYHLAGFPARASTLAAHRADDEQEAPLLRLLLRAEFPSLLETAVDVAASPPRRPGVPESEGEEAVLRIQELVSGEVASALGVICAELRWGRQRRVRAAVDKLRAAATALMPFSDPYGWLTVTLVAEVAENAVAQSLRSLVRPLESSVDDEGKRALERYVRAAYASGRALAWPSQARGLDRLAAGGSFALCTPTGSGKTTVAEIALLDGLFPADGGAADLPALCLYLVPTRALAAEVEGRLSRALRGVGGREAIAVTGLYGGTDWGPTDVWLSAENPTVLVSTQEKAEALVRFFGSRVVERIRLVVVDEAHEVQADSSGAERDSHESRALRLETLVARLRAQLGDQTRFIALSAVAHGIQAPLARWISGDEDPEPVVMPYRSTRQVIGRLRCQPQGRTRIELDLLDGQMIELADRDEGPFVPAPFAPVPSASGMVGAQKGLAPYALWAAMQLADERRERGGQSVLISIAQGIANWANWLNQLFDEWPDTEVPQFFSPPEDPDDARLWSRALASCGDYFGAASREFRLLERGIVVHHGRMPGRLPRLLIELVERRLARIVLATSTLSQGVNLPFETILVPGLHRQGGAMTGRELGNLAGRAGRPGVSTEGQTLVLLLEAQERWRAEAARRDYEAALAELAGAQTDAGPASALAGLIEEVRRLGPSESNELDAWLEATAPLDLNDADADTPAIRALDSLDAVLLAAMEEAGTSTPAAAEEALRRVWRQTFARYAAAKEAELEQTVVLRGRALGSIYSDRSQRTRIYRTGLPAREAGALENVTPEVIDHLWSGEAFTEWDDGARFEYIRRAVELLRSVPRFAVPEVVGRSSATWETVLRWWLDRRGADRQPTAAQVGQWHQFISQQFMYRFNWGLAGVLSTVQANIDESVGSLEIWGGGGLPWAAWWIKDIVAWGTLDPIAAYLLARGGVDVRDEAEEEAARYWSEVEEDGSDPLNPAEVRDWVSARAAERRRVGRRPPRRMAVELVADFNQWQSARPWRVLPVLQSRRLAWVDPAGVVLAESELVDRWRRDFASRYDFRLMPDEGVVTSRRYV